MLGKFLLLMVRRVVRFVSFGRWSFVGRRILLCGFCCIFKGCILFFVASVGLGAWFDLGRGFFGLGRIGGRVLV